VKRPAAHLTDLDALLAKTRAKMKAWEVQAFFLGMSASTNVRLGPHHHLERIFGEDMAFGSDIEEANANLQVVMGFWNHLQDERREGRLRLSDVTLSRPPTVGELRTLAERRHEEVRWFIRGIDAGGDDPIEFGAEGKKLLTGIAEGSGFVQAYINLLDRRPPATEKELVDAAETIAELTETIEGKMLDLNTVGADVRAEAIAAFETLEKSGGETDDGGKIRARTVKVGRNDPCPCGSGKKWKKCCGAVKPPGGVVQ